jgi:hypothetical protein
LHDSPSELAADVSIVPFGCHSHDRCSTARLIDFMGDNGAQAREVLYTREQWEEM